MSHVGIILGSVSYAHGREETHAVGMGRHVPSFNADALAATRMKRQRRRRW